MPTWLKNLSRFLSFLAAEKFVRMRRLIISEELRRKSPDPRGGNRANLHAGTAAKSLIERKQIMPREESHPINPLNTPVSYLPSLFYSWTQRPRT